MKRLLILSLAGALCFAQQQRESKPEPAFADVSYGPHERNVLDFWNAGSATPAPLVIYIHHVNFGIALKEKMDALGVEADLKYRGAESTYQSVADFFITKFGK